MFWSNYNIFDLNSQTTLNILVVRKTCNRKSRERILFGCLTFAMAISPTSTLLNINTDIEPAASEVIPRPAAPKMQQLLTFLLTLFPSSKQIHQPKIGEKCQKKAGKWKRYANKKWLTIKSYQEFVSLKDMNISRILGLRYSVNFEAKTLSFHPLL